MIDDCHLYNHIFTLSKRDSTTDPTALKKKPAFSIEGVLDPPHPPAESVVAGRLIDFLLQHRIAEFLQLNNVHLTLPWIMAGLAPWRGAIHPNPPKKEPKFLASLITKHELMYGEDIREVVEDTFEKRKMDLVKEAATRNEFNEISRQDAGTLVQCIKTDCSCIDSRVGSALANDYLHSITLRISSSHNPEYSNYVLILTLVSKAKLNGILSTYLTFLQRIYSLHVEDAFAVKRLIPVYSSITKLTLGK